MTFFYRFLATILLYSPVDPPEPLAALAEVPAVRAELHRLAVIEGVADETHYVGHCNLDAVRTMIRIQQDFPPEWMLLAFPRDRDWALINWNAARYFRDHCGDEARAATDAWEQRRWAALYDEAERRVRTWDALADSLMDRSPHPCALTYWRRLCLEKLRAEIGQGDLNAGRMPSPLPSLVRPAP